MEATIQEDFVDYLSRGLRRASIRRCSQWAEQYRVIKGKPWSHREWAWTREIQDAESRLVIGQKAAQVGYTECALNKTFFTLDIKKIDCLYVLPSKNDATDFSSGRFDPALEDSEHLRRMFSDVNNVGLKRAGSSVLYVRGGKSRSQLKSIPTGLIVLDEINEMPEEHIPLVLKRFSGQEIKQAFMLSTPDVPGQGINKFYVDSTMEHFFFPCLFCGKLIELKFPDSIVITAQSITDRTLKDSHYICYACKKPFTQAQKIEAISAGKFVAQHPERDNRGFQVNQMYSPRVEAWELAENYLKSLLDPTDEQEFYNSDLGEVHLVGDARVTQGHINDCMKRRPYLKDTRFESPLITMGVDVGANWHIEIDEWKQLPGYRDTLEVNAVFEPRLMLELEVPLAEGVKTILKLLRNYQVKGCIIDRHPETHLVNRITGRFPGLVYACMFGRSINGRKLIRNEDERTVTIDRTAWFDAALGRIINCKMLLPQNLSMTFQKHLQIPARIYDRDADGNPVGKWRSLSNKDHFALARVYSEAALPIALENCDSGPIASVF